MEAIHAPCGWHVSIFPAASFFCQSVGGLTGVQNMLWMLVGGGNELATRMYSELDLQFIANLTIHPAEVWAHSTVALNSMDDIKGLKIRLGTTELSSIFERLGATPVFLPGGEIYESCQRGVIDAFEYITPSLNWGMGFHEITDYLYLSPSRAPSDSQSLIINGDAWNELTPGLQMIVKNAAESVGPLFFAESVAMDAEALDWYTDYGTHVENLPKDIEDTLLTTAKEYYIEQAAKDPFYAEVYDSLQAFIEICELQGIR
ncbi:Lactate-binding periplasmic protein [subsurface metagenome]